MDRRSFLIAGAGLAVAARSTAFLQPAATRNTVFDWSSAGEGVHVAQGLGGNALLLVSGSEALLVDCKNMPMGPALRRECSLQAADPTLVVNTHHHADHTGGNPAFVGTVPVLAHAAAVPRIASQLDRYVGQYKQTGIELQSLAPKVRAQVEGDFEAIHKRIATISAAEFTPSKTFTDKETVRVGSIDVTLHHFGAGHTDNDAVVHVPSLNLVHTGDLLFNKVHPYVDRDAGANTPGWISSLRRIIEICDPKTVVIPGHGPVTDVGALHVQIAYFEHMVEVVRAARAAGKSRAEVASMNPEAYASYQGEWIRPITLGGIFDELESK